jgi:serine O-acetyltransferase
MRWLNYIREDIATVLDRDPAARSHLEVVLCYPGLHAIWIHRVSHAAWKHNLRLFARLLSQAGRFISGVDIHPGARIGRRVFIDHGSGVVIGETAIVGDDVTLFQGVTLGGTGKEKGKRHPTVGNRVTLGAGAKVLGNLLIGDNCRIGAGAVILRDVPQNSTVVGVPGHVVYTNGKRVAMMSPRDISHPLADIIASLSCDSRKLQADGFEPAVSIVSEPQISH